MAAHSFVWNYTTLVAALKAFVEDSGTDISGNIDTIIGLGELGLLRDLDLTIFDATDTGTFTPSSQSVTKPAGLVALRTLSFVASGVTYQMIPKTREFVLDYWPTAATTILLPKYYADLTDTTWLIAGTPSTGHTWTAGFVKRPNQLSSDTASNWLGTNCPDALFYACLVYSEEFLRNDEMTVVWKQEYAVKLAAAQFETRHHRRSDYAPLSRAPAPTREL